MRIATWNVNSIRTRAPRVLDWMQRHDIDVLAMQEIKCRPEQFPADPFERAGYELAIHGLNQWNGVAIASRHEISEIATSFAGMPGFGPAPAPPAATAKGTAGTVAGASAGRDAAAADRPVPGVATDGLPLEARALGVTIGDLRLWNLYVPNGRSLDHAHFAYKLRWLAALRDAVDQELAASPGLPLALLGDFNIAPFPGDMGDPAFEEGRSTHVSPQERALFAALTEPLSDVVRPHVPSGFTFWDYTRLRFPRDEGMRIDFILGSPAFAAAVTGASIHREERGGDAPSDHVPVVCDIDPSLLGETFEDEDDRPMIFG